MAFWGTEVKSGKPFTLHQSQRRLRISQATLGNGLSSEKSTLQCNVGNKAPILLCSLLPHKIECTPLNLEFEEAYEVIFSVIGPRSIYLSGYYLRKDGHAYGDDNDDSESYGVDIENSEGEESSDFGRTNEYDIDDDFIDDSDEIVSPPKRKSKGLINGKDDRKCVQNKRQDDDVGVVLLKGSTSMWDSETEDEDGGFPIPKSKAAERNIEDCAEGALGCKRKIKTVVHDGETGRRAEQLFDSCMPSFEVQPEKPKKKKLRKKGEILEVGDDKQDHHFGSVAEERHAKDEGLDIDAKHAGNDDQTDAKKVKKKKNKKTIIENDENLNDGAVRCLDIDAKHAGDDDHIDAKKVKKKKNKKTIPKTDENLNNDPERSLAIDAKHDKSEDQNDAKKTKKKKKHAPESDQNMNKGGTDQP